MKYPTDIEQAAESWNANCGPCSLAAILDRSLAETRLLLDGFEQRGYMNVTHVLKALEAAGVKFWCRSRPNEDRPACGLVFIQWGGHEKKPVRAQYKFTHWIAVDGDVVFEVNAPQLVSWDEWIAVMSKVSREEGFGDGTFSIRTSIQVRGFKI